MMPTNPVLSATAMVLGKVASPGQLQSAYREEWSQVLVASEVDEALAPRREDS